MDCARINGVELAYELRGAGEPLVMIHGAQGDQSMFSNFAPAFASHFRVLTFDQRGSGLSEKPDMDYSIAMLADDTAALMDHVGFSAAHIIGVSMGGTIAQEFALRHPRKVRSLVLGCTTAGGPKAIRIGGNAFANAYSTQPMSAEERGRALAEAAFTRGYIAQHPEIIREGWGEQIRTDPRTRWGDMVACSQVDLRDQIGRIDKPTLIIAGADDETTPPAMAELLASRIKSSRLEMVPDAGHYVTSEQPAAVNAALDKFLSELR